MDATTHSPARRLEGRVIILTGAAGAIGSVYARRLAREGARLALLDLDRERTEAIAAECRAQGTEAIALTVDVSDQDAVRGAVETVAARLGGVDGLVNNAAHFATLQHRPFEEIPASELDLLLAVNVRGPFLLCQAVAPHMRRRGGGKIVNIGSGSVLSAPRGLSHYVTSKGAIWAMTRVLARELGPDNITVNTLAPGLIITDAVLANHPAEGVVASRQSRSLARDEVPGDLEGTLVYLLSADSDFVSGQMLVVNGGSQLW